MKKRDKIIYIILMILVIAPILLTRLILEYDLRVYSDIKVGTSIPDALIKIKEINNKNNFLLNFFRNSDDNEESSNSLENDNFFLMKQKNKMILFSGLTYEENLKNNYYINNLVYDCYIVISFDEKAVIGNSFSCEDGYFQDILK